MKNALKWPARVWRDPDDATRVAQKDMSFGQPLTRIGVSLRDRRHSIRRAPVESPRNFPVSRRIQCTRLGAASLPRPEIREGPSTDFGVIWSRVKKLAMPYWTDPEVGGRARWHLAGVVALTVATTGVR